MTGKGQIKLVLLGPPGAGKGTQAAFLARAYNIVHISSGDMLREAAKEGGPAGQEIQGYMNAGKLVPDRIVTRSVIDRMARPDAARGVILDGYPRTRKQAEDLDGSLKDKGQALDIVLFLRTTEEVAIQRLSGRRVCPRCGKNYHIANIPPKEEGICDICRVDLVQREDDRPETIRNRLAVYNEQTKDIIAYYRERSLFRGVNGDLAAEKLFDDIDALFRREGLIDDDSEA